MTTIRSRGPRKKPPTDPRQHNFLSVLFGEEGPALVPLPSEQAPTGRGFSEDQRVRNLLSDGIRASAHGRDELAAAMGAGGEAVTKVQLDTWTGASRTNCFPVKHLKAFLRAIGVKAAFAFLTELLAGTGFVVLDERHAAFARIGQMVVMREALDSRVKAEAASWAPGWVRP